MERWEIADEAVIPIRTSGTGLRCAEQLRPGVENFTEDAAVLQGDVNSDPGRHRTVRADIGLGVENHDDYGGVVEMGVEAPPLIVPLFAPIS
jgi:hypothetical protein